MATAFAICCVAIILVPKMRRQILEELDSKMLGDTKRPAQGSSLPTVLSRVKMPAKSGFDNAAFKPDTPAVDNGVETRATSQSKDKTPTDHKRSELTLSAAQLKEEEKEVIGPVNKPIVAPKPPFLLRRQLAQDQQLEEIDLEPKDDSSKHSENGVRDIEDGRSPIGSTNDRPSMIRGERFEVFRLFSSLQILTACFASFAHGTNDVSNAVAPLIPIWNIYTTGEEDVRRQTQIWILAFGGIGICTGLWAWGRAVMSTVGDGLTQLTPSKGFSIELGAAISVLLATKLGLPISTTHCKVGSVVIVGLVSSRFCSQDNLLDMSSEEREKASANASVDWKLFGNIAITWLVTVPLAAAASACVMTVLKWLLL